MTIWTYRQAGGVEQWQAKLAKPHGRRRFVRVYRLTDGTVQAETATGYIRACDTVDEAQAYLEGEGLV